MKSTILAALEAAKEAGVRELTRTALVKYVYLLDCFYAEGHNGKTASGAQWHLNHFGPFAVDLVEAIDTFDSQGVIQSRDGTAGNKDFKLYRLAEYTRGQRLSDFGLSGTQEHRFTSLLKNVANDLARLLDHVYFDTPPMAGVRRTGDALDFYSMVGHAEVRPLKHTHINDQAAIMRLLQLSNALKEKRKRAPNIERAWQAHQPIYDREYVDAMKKADSESAVADAPLPFEATID